MKRDDSFLEKEIRDGFCVRSMVKRVWACQLDMLEEIDRVCRKYDIEYFVDGGTMLGAVRHKGYIPWDDDLDIGMRRTEYERFKKVAISELPQEYRFENDRSDHCEINDLVIHLRNSDRVRTDPEYLSSHHGCPYVVCIDIFIYDNLPDDPEERTTFVALYQNVFRLIWVARSCDDLETCSEDVRNTVAQLEQLTGFRFNIFQTLRTQLYILLDYLAASYYARNTEDVSIISYCMQNEKYIMKNKWIQNTIWMPFEDVMVPVPVGYHELLSLWYGDYMTPVRAESGHNYPYFKVQEAELIAEYERRGVKVPDYFLE